MSMFRLLAAAAVAATHSASLSAQADLLLPGVVITAAPPSDPLKVVTDPKAPRQPVPAHDGADYLKTIPGFSVIRKGGTDGDPIFRGMAGSRLGILLDGEQILGGCGGRMDPPTAYVFPESYDRVTVLKGPQTVLYGPGNSAGTVLFERTWKRFEAAGWRGNGSLLFGSFGRNDQVADATFGTPDVYARAIATRSHADDYEDGDGRAVHSRYTRWSVNAALGWTPDEHTRLELTGARSDGEAAYRDRSMDGVKFDRDNVGLKFERRDLSPLVTRIEAQVFYNYVDHVMDNYSLRTKPPAPTMYMVSNPDRETTGGRVAAGLRIADGRQLTIGGDAQRNLHTLRTAGAASGPPAFGALPRLEDARFRNAGLFGELVQQLGSRDRIVAGARGDRWHAEDQRQQLTIAGLGTVANPTASQSRDETLFAGFARWERDLAPDSTAQIGLGHTQRFPDYWELISATKESETTLSAFGTQPETTTQIDAGIVVLVDNLRLWGSLFANRIDDFILIQSRYAKGARTPTVVRNVDASSWGGELGATYGLGRNWKFDASAAYVRGSNDTDGTSMPQLPPLEGRLSAEWGGAAWSFGGLLRLVAAQDRFDLNKGNIAGQDLGSTPGFSVFSLNADYRIGKRVLIAAGIDNVFDRTYAEHVSRSGSQTITGYAQTVRVNEPGRNLWLRAQVVLD